MGHNPVNHPLRPIYRAIGGLTGIYFVLFGVIGAIITAGDGLFSNDTSRVLGQGSNLAWSIASVIVGALILLGVVTGRNIDVAVDNYLGWGLLVVGTYSLATIRTDVNFFNFTISTVVVTYLAGLVLIMTSYYSKVADTKDVGAPRQVRQNQAA
jgi:hypothetical protein